MASGSTISWQIEGDNMEAVTEFFLGLQKSLQMWLQPWNWKTLTPWIFIGRTDAEAETPILWWPDGKNWLIGKDPSAGKDWRQEGKGKIEHEMVPRHHWLKGHEFEQALGVGDGQGSLVCCSPWSRSWTLLSNWTELNWKWLSHLVYKLLLHSKSRDYSEYV